MSLEAYSVAVRLHLINNVSTGLAAISGHLNKTGMDAKALQAELHKIKLIGLAGAAIGGAGFMGLALVGKMIGPAAQYAHQLNIMNMAGMKQAEIADAVGSAWKNTGTILTSTTTGNLRALLDMKNILGNFSEAQMMLPFVTKVQAVLAASKEGKLSSNSTDMAYGMAKALDIIGAVRSPERFKAESEAMARVIIATQGRVTPDAYKSVFQYARQAKLSMSDTYKYEILPTLIQENASGGGGGGGSKGVGPMLAAAYRWTNQGFVNKKSLPELISLGLAGKGTHLKTTTSGTTIGPMKGAGLAGENLFEWVNKILVPSIYAKYGRIADMGVISHINELTRGNQLAGSLITEYFYKQQNFLRDQKIILGAMPVDQAYAAAISNDPDTAMAALKSQWNNFKTSFMMGVVPVVIPALIKMSEGLNALAAWSRQNPNLTKDIALGFIGLSGAMAFSGTVMVLTAGFKGLGLIIGLLGTGAGTGAAGLASAAIGGLITFLTGPVGLVIGIAAVGVAALGLSGKLETWWEKIKKVDSALAYHGYTPLTNKDVTTPFKGDSWFSKMMNYGGMAGNSQPVHATINFIVDGQTMASKVVRHMERAMSGPQSGITGPDSSMHMPSPANLY